METELSYHPIREDEKQAICEWVYDGEYSIYNLPSYEEMKEKNLGFANPQKEKNFYTYFDNDTLVGFTNILEEETEVFIGIGVNPDCCSKGYGQKILEIASQICTQKYPGKPLYLEVRTWNQRAVACYERAGFVITKKVQLTTQLGPGLFYHMETNLSDESIRDTAAKSSK